MITGHQWFVWHLHVPYAKKGVLQNPHNKKVEAVSTKKSVVSPDFLL
jgi:hypothetical protein